MKKNLGFWRAIGAPNFILSIIEKGCKLPFANFPVAVRLRNNKSARLHADFVDQAVLELTLVGFVGLMSNLQLLTPRQFLYSPAVKRG